MKKWLIRLSQFIIGLPIALSLFVAATFWLVNRTNGKLISSGVKRTYLLYVPKSYDPSRPTPLVICIHGYAQWPAHQMLVSHWNNLADQYGFIVVYPSGTSFPKHWRASGAAGGDAGPMPDVTFLSDLIDHLEREYNIDPARIYANGLSNGGGMTFVLSCKLAERIAAVGMVAGAYLYPWEECKPPRQVPAIVFHGTDDPVVPYQGGPSHSFELPFPAVPQWVEALASRNGCDGNPQQLPPNGEVSGVKYTSCAADVVFYTIHGGGHSWPGGGAIPKWIAGHTTKDIDATRIMWEFFQQHPLPGR